MKFFTKFLASQFSGWLLLVVLGVGGIAAGVVWNWVSDYKTLQIDAAYCKGQLSNQKILRSIQNRAADAIKDNAADVIEDIQDLRDGQNDETNPEMGCAGERAPDAILRYHGWVSGD